MNLGDCWACYGCSVILEQSEFESDASEDEESDGVCPECGSTDVGPLE